MMSPGAQSPGKLSASGGQAFAACLDAANAKLW